MTFYARFTFRLPTVAFPDAPLLLGALGAVACVSLSLYRVYAVRKSPLSRRILSAGPLMKRTETLSKTYCAIINLSSLTSLECYACLISIDLFPIPVWATNIQSDLGASGLGSVA